MFDLKKYSLKKSGLILMLVLIMLRIIPFGSSKEPGLERELYGVLNAAELRRALANDSQGRCSKHPCMDDLLTKGNNMVKITSYTVSRPLLSTKDTRYIVKVNYLDSMGEDSVGYYKFGWNPIGGWLYKYPSSTVIYYLNFFF